MNGVIDTSVFVAVEQGRALDAAQLPMSGGVSAMTLAELEVGVRTASSAADRRLRLTLNAVRDAYVALPVDEAVASATAT